MPVLHLTSCEILHLRKQLMWQAQKYWRSRVSAD